MSHLEEIYNWLDVAGVPTLGTPQQFNLFQDLVLEELEETKVAFIEYNMTRDDSHNVIKGINDIAREEMLDGFVDLTWMVMNGAFMMGFSIEELNQKFADVLKSNLSKFCDNEDDAILSVELYKTGKHPTKIGQEIDAYYEKVGDWYIIKRSSDNKVLKSHKFIEP